jgi:hypothetical protein
MLEMQPSYLAMIMAEVTNLQNLGSKDTDDVSDSSSLPVSHKEIQHRRGSRAELAFRFKLILLSRQWNICAYQSQTGWDFGFRTWNWISFGSPVQTLYLA